MGAECRAAGTEMEPRPRQQLLPFPRSLVPLVGATIFRADYDKRRGEGLPKVGGTLHGSGTHDGRRGNGDPRPEPRLPPPPPRRRPKPRPTTTTAAGAIPRNPAARQGEDSNKPRTLHDERRQRGTAGGRKPTFQHTQSHAERRGLRQTLENCLYHRKH